MIPLVVLILSSLMVHRLAVVLQYTAAFYPPCPSVLTGQEGSPRVAGAI